MHDLLFYFYIILPKFIVLVLNRFVAVESSKLDLIIKRCKRITGILLIMKKFLNLFIIF